MPTDKDKARKIHELCAEFEYLDKRKFPFEDLYEMVESDRSLDMSADRKFLMLSAFLAGDPSSEDKIHRILTEWKKDKTREVDMEKLIVGIAIGIGAVLVLSRVLRTSRKEKPEADKKPPAPAEQKNAGDGDVPINSAQPTVLAATLTATFALLAVESKTLAEKFPEFANQKMVKLDSGKADDFYKKLDWYVLADQNEAKVQSLRSRCNAGPVENGFTVLALKNPAYMAAFRKGNSPARREAFLNLGGVSFEVLGSVPGGGQFPPAGFDFYTK
jgi:hypothetical protein